MDEIEALRTIMEAVHRKLEAHDAKVDQSVTMLRDTQRTIADSVAAIRENTDRVAAAAEMIAKSNGRGAGNLVKWLAGAVVLASLGAEGLKALVAAFGGPR